MIPEVNVTTHEDGALILSAGHKAPPLAVWRSDVWDDIMAT